MIKKTDWMDYKEIILENNTDTCQPSVILVISCLICLAASFAIPLHYNIERSQEFPNRAQPSNGFFGSIGTALIPVFDAVVSKLATGIASTFNHGVAAGANGMNPDNGIAANGFNTSHNSIKTTNQANYNHPEPIFDAFMVQLPNRVSFLVITKQKINDFSHLGDELVELRSVISKIQLKELDGLSSSIQANTKLKDSKTSLDN